VRSDLLAPARTHARRRRASAAAVALALVAAAAAAAWRIDLPRQHAERLYDDPAPAAPALLADKRPPAAPVIVDAVAAPPRPAASVQTRPLSAWLGDIARDAKRELVISPAIQGDLTASAGAERLDWRERIDAYSRVFGFEFAVGDGLIEVRPPPSRPSGASRDVPKASAADDRQREAAIGAANAGPRAHEADDAGTGAGAVDGAGERGAGGSREGRSSATPAGNAGKPAAPPSETRVASLSYAPAKELASVVDKAAQALGVAAAADIASNALVLSGPRDGLEKAAALVAQLDRPRRRVLLEAKIVEIAHSARRDLGIEWKLTGDIGGDVRLPAPVSDAGSAALLIATNGASALDARISAMEADGRLRVVSRPSVVMLEGSPATIESVRILRIRLPSRGAVVGDEVVDVGNGGDRATQDIPVGVRLEVTPGIRAGRKVLLRIAAKSSSLGAPLPPDDIPEELSRMVEAEVMVADGETAVLGGLLREGSSRTGAGVPLLRDVPVLGHVFDRRSRHKESEELLVLVTPRVLD